MTNTNFCKTCTPKQQYVNFSKFQKEPLALFDKTKHAPNVEYTILALLYLNTRARGREKREKVQ